MMTKEQLTPLWAELRKHGVFALIAAGLFLAFWQISVLPAQKNQQAIVDTQIAAFRTQADTMSRQADALHELTRRLEGLQRDHADQIKILERVLQCAEQKGWGPPGVPGPGPG